MSRKWLLPLLLVATVALATLGNWHWLRMARAHPSDSRRVAVGVLLMLDSGHVFYLQAGAALPSRCGGHWSLPWRSDVSLSHTPQSAARLLATLLPPAPSRPPLQPLRVVGADGGEQHAFFVHAVSPHEATLLRASGRFVTWQGAARLRHCDAEQASASLLATLAACRARFDRLPTSCGVDAPRGHGEQIQFFDGAERALGVADIDWVHRFGMRHLGCWMLLLDGDGRALLELRSVRMKTCANSWTIFGEHHQPFEALLATAQRGLAEELSLHVRATDLHFVANLSYSHTADGRRDVQLPTAVYALHASPTLVRALNATSADRASVGATQQLRIDRDEIAQLRWFTRRELAALPLASPAQPGVCSARLVSATLQVLDAACRRWFAQRRDAACHQ